MDPDAVTTVPTTGRRPLTGPRYCRLCKNVLPALLRSELIPA
jgi:hypothetical protein